MALISVTEYAKKIGRNRSAVIRKIYIGFPAVRVGNLWKVEETTPWIDDRIKSGKYIGWRKNLDKSKKES